MARLTRGYPFAFQVLGYFTYENNGDYSSSIPTFRQYLDDYVYTKMWSELSATDKKVLYTIANILSQDKKSSSARISEIRERLNMESNEFSPYRDRLIKRGILNGSERGYVRFELPLFEDFIMDNYMM